MSPGNIAFKFTPSVVRDIFVRRISRGDNIVFDGEGVGKVKTRDSAPENSWKSRANLPPGRTRPLA
jgi:hypothetical protein